MVFEGMVIAGYAVGADIGLLYLRYEYKYLLNYLDGILDKMRASNMLGNEISGISDLILISEFNLEQEHIFVVKSQH